MTDIRSLLKKSARDVRDPAGRKTRIIEEHTATGLAAGAGLTLHDTYLAAMDLGIWPNRYLRNRDSLSLQEQLKLGRARVAVIGSGGLGGHVILLLARIGIGTLTVVDFDVFDETNLNRQAVSSVAALGRPKCLEAEAMVAAVNPSVRLRAHRERIDDRNADRLLAGAQVAVDALDNVGDRIVLENAARRADIPYVHGAIAGFEGQLMTVYPEDGGLRGLYETDPGDRKDPKRPEAVLGVPTLTPALIAVLQAMEVIKILLNRGRPLRNRILHADLETTRFSEFDLS